MTKQEIHTFFRGNGYNYFTVPVVYNNSLLMQCFQFFIKRFLPGMGILMAAACCYGQHKLVDLPFALAAGNGFLENKGQVQDQFRQSNKAVKFLLSAKGMNVQLKKNGFSYDTYEELPGPAASTEKIIQPGKWPAKTASLFRFHRVDIQFPGANPFPQVIAEGKQAAHSIFYHTASPQAIIANYFDRVIYKDLYPRIDLVFDTRNSSNQWGFEYYFIVQPGGDPRQIRMQYNGAETKLTANAIVIQLGNRNINETIPASFLSDNYPAGLSALSNQLSINVSYKDFGSNTYGFNLPYYNKTKTLVIDPVPGLVWGTYYGGSLNDWAYCMAKSPDGNILVAGSSVNTNVATAGAYQSGFAGFEDGLFGKFSADGQLIWMSYYGGDQSESIYGICTDNTGNIFIAGITDSQTGIATPGAHQPLHGNTLYGRDGFLAKFTGSGSRVWATYYGGSSADEIEAIRADASGNIFIAGWTNSRNAIATRNAFQPAYGSDPNPQHAGDGFLARFDNDGNQVWATYYGGSYLDRFHDLAIDGKGNIYAAGIAYSENSIASPGAWQTVFGGGYDDAMMVKFDNGGRRVWASYYGGAKEDYAATITCDNQNNVIIGGMSISHNAIATPGTVQPVYGGGPRDGFLAKFNENGQRNWGSYYGGSGEDFIHGLSCDQNNNIIIAGSTYSTDNIATGNVYQPTGPALLGDWTAYIAKLGVNGNRIWGTYYGYGGLNAGYTSAAFTDNSGNIFVCGVTRATNGVASCDAFQKNLGGNQDMFVGMFNESAAAFAPAVAISLDAASAVCTGSPVSFKAEAINTGVHPFYQWKINGINAGSNAAVFTAPNPLNGDTIVCTVTSASVCNNLPISSNAIIVALNPSVIPSVSILSSASASICAGMPVSFTALPVNGGNTPAYQWKLNGNNVGTNNPVFAINTLANGDMVSCSLTNLNSCNPVTQAVSNTIAMAVRTDAYPSVSISAGVDSICSGEMVAFKAEAVNGGNNPIYQWLVNGSPAGNGISFTSRVLSVNDTIQCLLKPGSNNCTVASAIVSNKISIKVNKVPAIIVLPANPVIFKGDTVQLSVTGSSDIARYKWTPAQDISSDRIANPQLWPPATRVYRVEAASFRGCIASKEVKVGVLSAIAVPNAFTPNNDGLNDVWKIKGLDLYTNCRVSVFNRFGQLVYQSSGYANPWNGRYKSQLLAPGSFAYIISLGNGTKPLTGSVMIIR